MHDIAGDGIRARIASPRTKVRVYTVFTSTLLCPTDRDGRRDIVYHEARR